MSIMQHIQNIVTTSGKKSILGFLFSRDAASCIIDGNLAHNLLIKPSDGKLIGQDYNGNKYFENPDLPYGRKRWVVYADHVSFDYNSTTVPPEWHGWLNYINDYAPPTHDFKKPIYEVAAYKTRTGTSAAYQPKGAWNNAHKRNWLKYEAWKP